MGLRHEKSVYTVEVLKQLQLGYKLKNSVPKILKLGLLKSHLTQTIELFYNLRILSYT